MKQDRVAIDKLNLIIEEKVSLKKALQKLN
jgi:hypothetical protein